VPMGSMTRMAAALEADLDVRLRWRGEGLDRLLDRAHAALVETVVELLHARSWETVVEVSFSKWGERGSIDVLARHAGTETVLVVEVKSVVPDSQAMMQSLDRKARLAPDVARDRGWTCRHVARLLVVGESSTSRRRISSLGATYSAAFPTVGWGARRWLGAPSGGMSGLLFLPYDRGGSTTARSTGVQRVRKRGIRRSSSYTPAPDADEKDPGLGSS